MTTQLAYIGVLMLVFGLGSYYITEHLAAYNVVNVIAGTIALLAAAVGGMRRLRVGAGPHARRVITRGVLTIVGATALGTAIERAAYYADIRFDWTFERRFELAEATRKACADLGSGLRATLYHDEADPRTRRTKLLLRTLADSCDMKVYTEILDRDSADVDRFEIGSSNTVVLEYGLRFETVERPTEGAIYEALYRLRSLQGGTIVVLRGEGEGDPDGTGDAGFSGLATALTNEGYQLRPLATPLLTEIPEDTQLVLSLAPQRRIRDEPLEALARYLNGGGRLVALLEPGVDSGIEDLLARYGLESPNSLVIDPSSGALDQQVAGLNPVVYNYTTHPVTRGLNSNRMTFFSGARSFVLHKPEPEDRIVSVVMASPQSWLSDDLSLLHLHSGQPERDGARTDFYPLVVTGKYRREAGETRIVAFGDSDFATNRYLRAVYNLDLIVNAVHWAAERESEITLRPKVGAPLHFPLPIADSLRTLYSVGLLVPEILLIAGGVVWLRRRGA